MISTYYGEFLTSPVPLELSLNYCSHGCSFCFANLSKRDRKADMKQVMGLLSAFRERRTLEALLLREGYPVLISNRVDPFANSNYQQSLAVIETCVALGIPMAFQTRGGRGIDEALSILAPSCWYISINTASEDLRERLEPGAPSLASRYALIEKLRAAGHRVVLGLNPCVPEWVPDPLAVLAPAKAAGAEGVWCEALHFNRDQVAAMKPRERESVGEDLIKRACKRSVTPDDAAHVDLALDLADEIGLAPFRMLQSRRSNFWDPFTETYPRLFPVLQEFINALHDVEAEGVDFETFAYWALRDLPHGDRLPIDGYIGSVARNVLAGTVDVPWHDGPYKIPPRMDFSEVLKLFWCLPNMTASVVQCEAFSFVATDTGSDGAQLVGDDGMPLMMFHAAGTLDYWDITPTEGE